MDVRAGPWRRLSAKELMLLNCRYWRRLLRVPLDCKEIQSVHPKGNQPWMFIGRTGCWSWSSNPLDTCYKEPTQWKRPWCWERLRAGGEGDDRGWDGWMASPTQWTWVWANSGRQWRTQKPDMLQPMGSRSIRHDLVAEQQQWLMYNIIQVRGVQCSDSQFLKVILLI